MRLPPNPLLLRRLVLCLALSAVATAAPAAGPSWHTRVPEAATAAASSGKLILVDLYADWCGWCKKLDQEVFSTPRFQNYAERFVLLRVDTEDGGEGSELAERFGAWSLPTTLILTPALARAGEVRGYAPVERFIARIDEELAGWESLGKRYGELAAGESGDDLRLLAEELHQRLDGERAAALYTRLLATGPAPAEAVELRYLVADAWRLAQRFEEAETAVAALRDEAAEDPQLAAELELLRFRIARDRGRCAEAIALLETFLAERPGSSFEDYARQALAGLRQRGEAACRS